MCASLEESKNQLVFRCLPLNVQLELKMVSLMLDMLETDEVGEAGSVFGFEVFSGR